MKDFSKRIEDCSPERRKLIERLLRKKGLHIQSGQLVPESDRLPPDKPSEPTHGSAPPLAENLRAGSPSFVHQKPLSENRKGEISRFYNCISEQLDSSIFGKSSYFLNLGYVANKNLQYSRIKLPEHLLDKNSIKLVLETIGDFDITGSRVLDVGCGRGGTIVILNKYFKIKAAVGIDLSLSALSFCNKCHQYKESRFVNADAENLPFTDRSFDVVINIESSHSYPNIVFFYNEVARILKTGGYFLYADFFADREHVATCVEVLRGLDLIVERDQDVTTNVLASCDEIATLRLKAFGNNDTDEGMRNFLAAPGSAVYDEMRSGKASFRIFRLHKVE